MPHMILNISVRTNTYAIGVKYGTCPHDMLSSHAMSKKKL